MKGVVHQPRTEGRKQGRAKASKEGRKDGRTQGKRERTAVAPFGSCPFDGSTPSP